MMTFLLSAAFYSAMIATASAARCATKGFDSNMPGTAGGTLKQIEAVFPTFRQVVLDEGTRAIIWIDPADCNAADLDERFAKVEALLGRSVELRAASDDFRAIAAYRYPEVLTTRKLKQVFPSLSLRGDKIGENVEVLVVEAADFHTWDRAERQRKAEEIVGRPVDLRIQP